jgi:protein O-GlcNAc transferase
MINFSNRIAPIQISYLGYPGTSGNKNIDYIISDETIIPKSNFKFFSEKVLYLPNCYQANMSQKEISEKNYTRRVWFTQNGFVYCCFNNNYKITPDIFNSWIRILNKVKNSFLWILNTNDVADE